MSRREGREGAGRNEDLLTAIHSKKK